MILTYHFKKKKARGLRDTYTDEQIEEFKIKLKELSNLYWKS